MMSETMLPSLLISFTFCFRLSLFLYTEQLPNVCLAAYEKIMTPHLVVLPYLG